MTELSDPSGPAVSRNQQSDFWILGRWIKASSQSEFSFAAEVTKKTKESHDRGENERATEQNKRKSQADFPSVNFTEYCIGWTCSTTDWHHKTLFYLLGWRLEFSSGCLSDWFCLLTAVFTGWCIYWLMYLLAGVSTGWCIYWLVYLLAGVFTGWCIYWCKHT